MDVTVAVGGGGAGMVLGSTGDPPMSATLMAIRPIVNKRKYIIALFYLLESIETFSAFFIASCLLHDDLLHGATNCVLKRFATCHLNVSISQFQIKKFRLV